MSDLKATFEEAAQAATNLAKKPDNNAMLQLYAFYKQATVGDVQGSRPGFSDFIARAKYDAWSKVKGTTQDGAMQSYIDLVKKLQGNFDVMPYPLLFLTERSPRHQQSARRQAPESVTVNFLSHSDKKAILQQVKDAEFLITERAGRIDSEIIAAAPNLRLIQRLGSLTHDIDLDAAQRAMIPVCATPVLGCIMVAEHMLFQMIALAKKAPDVTAVTNAAGQWRQSRRTDENIFAYNWSGRTKVRSLYQSTIGILGFGEIGVELARIVKGIRPARILYHKRSRLPIAVENELGLTYAQPTEIYQQSDILCCLLPYAKETDMSLNAAVFVQMKRAALLVHCGSGSVIDESALTDAIRSGQIGGAALDTFEWEPIKPDNPLLALARTADFNVLLTPHTAAGSGDFYASHRSNDYENVARVLEGKPLLDRVC